MEWFPHINWIEPAEEREEAQHISHQIAALQMHQDYFASALSLFDNIEAAREHSLNAGHPISERAAMAKWQMIAANHAALTIYHFQSTLRSIRDRLQYAPTLAANVDSKALQDAYDRFHAEFPAWKWVRDWVAHSADKLFKPQDIEDHRSQDSPFVHGSLMGRTLTFTRKGEYIRLDMTQENLDRLRSIKNDAFRAFRKVSVWPFPS